MGNKNSEKERDNELMMKKKMLNILERKIRRAEATQPARRQAGERERDGYLHSGGMRGRSRLGRSDSGGIACVRERGTTKES